MRPPWETRKLSTLLLPLEKDSVVPSVGLEEGDRLGSEVGNPLGALVGASEGLVLGKLDGREEGAPLGDPPVRVEQEAQRRWRRPSQQSVAFFGHEFDEQF